MSALIFLPLWETPAEPEAAIDNPILKGISWFADHFIGLFQEAATQFTGLASGILPLLIVLLTLLYSVTAWIGEERVTRAVQWSARWAVTRYTIMPILAVIMLTNPMAYSFGMYLPERQKPAFYDSAVSFVHPVTAFFPHANAGEYFVWAGISAGVLARDPGRYGLLAALYFLVGIVVIFIRGISTEWVTRLLIRRQGLKEVFDEYDAQHLKASKKVQLPGGASRVALQPVSAVPQFGFGLRAVKGLKGGAL